MFNNLVVGHSPLSCIRDNVSTPRDALSRTVVRMGRKAKELPPPSKETLDGRIRIGMATVGISGPTALAAKMGDGLNRQTTAKWITGESGYLEPKYLFKLAKVLNVNPEWLALGRGPVAPAVEISPNKKRVLELYEALGLMQDAWIQSGDTLLKAAREASISQPFKRPQKTR